MSKAQILHSISRNKPAAADLPSQQRVARDGDNALLQEFIEKARGAGSEIENFDSVEKVGSWIHQQGKNGNTVINLLQEKNENDLDEVGMVVVKGQFGVAENGAIWIDEEDMQLRKLPFVTSHLVLVLVKSKILPDLHEAYRQVDLDRSGFGVFIAGPSKTADIEQALVIGAHGPIKHTILLY